MTVTKSIEYDTCSYCGEPVRRLTITGLFHRIRSRTTTHVRHIRSQDNRCLYDDGPYADSIALTPYPGDL